MGNVVSRRICAMTISQLAVCCGIAILCSGVAYGESPFDPTSSRAAREEAIRSIPFDQLRADTRSRISGVVKKPSIYRRLPVEAIYSDPDMYLFLVRYPEVIVNIWRIMGITQCVTSRTGPYNLNGSDGMGTRCNIELVYGTPELHVIIAEGSYESGGGLLKRTIKGRCVILLRTGYTQDGHQRSIVTNKMDMFIQMDNIGVDLLAKSFHSLVSKTADYNFTQSAQFIARLSDLSERNGPGVQRLAAKLKDVDPAVRARFADLAGIANQRAVLRNANYQVRPNQPGLVQSSANR